jgi:hypothetical protein
MIQLDGAEYGRAHEIAARLGPDITTAMIRRWADRGHLDRRKLPDGSVWFRVDQAADAEAAARRSGRGRPRSGRPLDTPSPSA